MTETIAVFDYDAIAFRAAAATEKKQIRAVHKKSGDEKVFKSRTELWGHWKKKEGGWLAEQRKSGIDVTWEDYDIIDFSEPEPIQNAIQITKKLISTAVSDVSATNYYGYIGGAENFRIERSTLIKYKGQRDDLVKPKHLEDIKRYIQTHHAGEIAKGVEADDLVAGDVYGGFVSGTRVIGVGLDKDYKGCEGIWWNFVNKKLLHVKGLGELFRDKEGAVDGYGRLFKYWQICYGDDADNYFAACASRQPNGEVTAYDALKGAKTDKEAWEKIVKHFKRLYPEPTIVTGWRGDPIKIDWLYVLQEMTDMAHMQRWAGDCIHVKSVLDKLGVSYE